MSDRAWLFFAVGCAVGAVLASYAFSLGEPPPARWESVDGVTITTDGKNILVNP